jgi:hypothetical protein
MPVIKLDYVAKGAAHTTVLPSTTALKDPEPARVGYTTVVQEARHIPTEAEQLALLAAMRLAVRGANNSAGFGTVIDLNAAMVEPPVVEDIRPVTMNELARRAGVEDIAPRHDVRLKSTPIGKRNLLRDELS